MNCPDCDGNTKVIDSRQWAGTRYRKRVCADCGFKFWTVEEDASPKEVREMMAALKMRQRAK